MEWLYLYDKELLKLIRSEYKLRISRTKRLSNIPDSGKHILKKLILEDARNAAKSQYFLKYGTLYREHRLKHIR